MPPVFAPTIENFTESLYVANGPIKCELVSGAFDELVIRLAGGYTGTTPVNLSDDAPWNLVGQLVLEHHGPRIAMHARRLYHYSAMLAGGYSNRLAQTVASPGFFSGAIRLPFKRIMKGLGIDASSVVAAITGRWNPNTYYSGTAPGVINTTSAMRPTVETAPVAPVGGFFAPEWTEHTIQTPNANIDHNITIDFSSDEAFALPHIMLFAYDASGGFGTDAAARVDGLVRTVTVRLMGRGQTKDLVKNVRWGALRAQTVQKLGGGADDEASSSGVVFLELSELDDKGQKIPLVMPPNAKLLVSVDTFTPVEEGYTNVAAANGDTVSVCVFKNRLRRGDANGQATAIETTAKAKAQGKGFGFKTS